MTAPTPPSEPLPVRKVRFDYPPDSNLVWNPRFPEFSCAANSISLLMPSAEPYFVRTMRSVRDRLDEPLRSRTAEFGVQEYRHSRQHRRFNAIVARQAPRILTVESWVSRTYGFLERRASQRFSVAFVAGSETLAYAIARWTEKNAVRLFRGADQVPATMFLWHLAEEVEHKSAAFDVFEALDGSRLRYTAAMTLSFALLAWFVVIASFVQLAAIGRAFNPLAWFRLARWSLSLAFSMLPTMAVSTMPGHHPSSFSDPIYLSTWLRQYDPVTATMPVPSVVEPFPSAA